jgi:hypothetical protein
MNLLIITLMSKFNTYVLINIIYCVGCDNMSFTNKGKRASINSSEHTHIQVEQKACVHLMITIQEVTNIIQQHYHKTRLSYLNSCLNRTAWQLSARASGTLDTHKRHLLPLILTTLPW